MEKNGNILYVSDTVTGQIFNLLKGQVENRYKNNELYNLKINEDKIKSVTDFLVDIDNKIMDGINIIILHIGLSDILSGMPEDYFFQSYEKIVLELQKRKIRTIMVSIHPLKGYSEKKWNKELSSISKKYKIRFANIENYWSRNIGKEGEVISEKGRNAIVKAIIPVLIRTKILILWQFNGRYAHCNYSCPYCYVATSVNKGMHFKFDIKLWEEAFIKHFGEADAVFYFSYGEPMMASKFYEVLEMIGNHPNWQVRMTSNMSLPLDKLLKTRVVKEGRMNINASFHPTQITIEKFIEKCNNLRNCGIEPSVIYVMYPEQIDDFENKYMPLLRKEGYRVHIRAFRGLYKGRKYPGAYTREQWKKTAKYMDSANFKYQLGEVNGLGRLSMLGVTHILVDNEGKIEMCDSYVGDRHYGNIFDENLELDLEPKPFPGLVPLAAVDDIADYVELEYEDLVDNNVNDYNTLGGVTINKDGSINYPYEYINFDKENIKELSRVPKPAKAAWKFWLNPRWFCYHFIYSFIIKKYGKYVWAWIKGKYNLLKRGKLSLRNFWHS